MTGCASGFGFVSASLSTMLHFYSAILLHAMPATLTCKLLHAQLADYLEAPPLAWLRRLWAAAGPDGTATASGERSMPPQTQA